MSSVDPAVEAAVLDGLRRELHTTLVVIAVWLTDLSFQRAALLAPVLVIGVGALAGLVVFWGRIGWDSIRRSRHRPFKRP